jgi:hypothetical protein
MPSRCEVRRRARPTCREVQVPGWSVRLTRGWVARATWQTEGAREVQAAWPWGWARRWPFQGRVQPWGSLGSSRPAWRRSSVQMAREMGESACTGTKTLALEGCQVGRACERPPPGTMSWRWGWDWRCRPQGWRTPVQPGRSVPLQRSALARRLRAVADAGHRAWDARRGGARMQGRRVAGTVQVRRQGGPGRGVSRCCWSPGWVICGCHGGQCRLPQASWTRGGSLPLGHGERRWPSGPLGHGGMALRTLRWARGRGGERARDAGAQAVPSARRVVRAAAQAGGR